MPDISVASLHQKAVLWPATGIADSFGQAQVGNRVEISVRYEESLREATNPEGNSVALAGTMFVDREIGVGSEVWIGALANLPSPIVDILQVVNYQEVPDIKGRHSTRIVTLMRKSDEPAGT